MKTNWTLLDFETLEEAVKVLQKGCGNHIADSWKNEPIEVDIESLLRHILDYVKGIKVDRDSGFHSLSHAMCRCMFIINKDKRKDKQYEVAQKKMDMERAAKDNEHYNIDSNFKCNKCKSIFTLKNAAAFLTDNPKIIFCTDCLESTK